MQSRSTNPVDFNLQSQQPDPIPTLPMVKPNDPAMRLASLFNVPRNKVLGTDKAKRGVVDRANTVNTKTPANIKPLKEVPVEKISLPTMAGSGLGLYASDLFTRDQRQRHQRQLEREWELALENQKRGNLKKSAWDKLQDYYTVSKVPLFR